MLLILSFITSTMLILFLLQPKEKSEKEEDGEEVDEAVGETGVKSDL